MISAQFITFFLTENYVIIRSKLKEKECNVAFKGIEYDYRSRERANISCMRESERAIVWKKERMREVRVYKYERKSAMI